MEKELKWNEMGRLWVEEKGATEKSLSNFFLLASGYC
jgi:hypothetical protein